MSSRQWSSSSNAKCATPDFGVVAHRAAELLELDLLARDRLDHVGAGDEHVRRLLDHEDEVRHGGGVDGAAGARAHDQADLRDHAGALDVAHEHVAVRAERDDALLDPRAAGVVDADDRAADLGGQVHHLAHLLAHDLAERAAEHGEVLAEHAHAAAVDRPVAGDDRVAPGARLVHLEVVRAVAHVRVELLERAGVEQLLDPLAGRVLALRVLLLDRLLGGVVDRGVAQLLRAGRASLRSSRGLSRAWPSGSLCPRASAAARPDLQRDRRARAVGVARQHAQPEPLRRAIAREPAADAQRALPQLRPQRARALGQRDQQLAVARQPDRAAREPLPVGRAPARRGARASASR